MITSFYLKNLLRFCGGLLGAGIAIFAFAGGGLINYHCTANNAQPLLGYSISSNPACSIIVVISYLLICLAVVILALLIITIILDAIGFVYGSSRKTIIKILRRKWSAKFIFAPVQVNNEIYIAVSNQERWLSAKDVHAFTKFSYNVIPYSGFVKWDKHPLGTMKTDISKDEYELLHFASIDYENWNLAIHKSDGNMFLPVRESILILPLHIYGQMFLWRFRIEKIILNHWVDVVIEQKNGIEVRIQR